MTDEKDLERAIKNREIFLAETILSIHNEVQSAVDYISEVAAVQGTELGKGPALMGIEKIRLKLPFVFEVEQKTGSVRPVPEAPDIMKIRENLASRKGFLIDTGTPGKRGLFTKIRIQPAQKAAPVEREAEEGPGTLTGEIEIVFSPMGRE